MITTTFTITVGARASALSKAQTIEVLEELKNFHPMVAFEAKFVETTGDKDLQTSLRSLDKTDFFTKEIDRMVLEGECQVGIHSAKDLPDPLSQGLKMIALTKGVDPADVLVLRPGVNLEDLPKGALIATSSIRREEAVLQLRKDLTFRDLRGTVPQRIQLLDRGEADGVVVAEAALIRLGLTHLNRVRLPGETTLHQGRIAILAREDDEEMEQLFSCLDSR